MYKFSYIINTGEHAGENHTYSVKAKNINDALVKAKEWCSEAKVTFRTVTKLNK